MLHQALTRPQAKAVVLSEEAATPVLSIITICLNCSTALEKTIRSVMSQSWQNFEFLVIDGGSTDDTLNIYERYRDEIDIFISETDEGIYDAQNKGIKQARGDYILFLNAGDYLAGPQVLHSIFHEIPAADLIYGDVILNAGNNSFVERKYPKKIDRHYWRRDFLCHQVIFHRRSLFTRFGLYNTEYRFVSDHELLFKIWNDQLLKKLHIPEFVAYYDTRGLSSRPELRENIMSEYNSILLNHFNARFIEQKTNSLRRIFARMTQRTLALVNWQGIGHAAELALSLFKPRIREAPFLRLRQLREQRIKGELRKLALIFNTSDGYGGAARASYRIMSSLKDSEFTSMMAVKSKELENDSIIQIPKKSVVSILGEILKFTLLKIRARRKTSANSVFSSTCYVSKSDCRLVLESLSPEIVHLNWIGQNLLTIEEIGEIKSPIVWTFHDMWPFCGGEHLSSDERYVSGYSAQNRPSHETGFDINRWTWERKMKSFSRIENLHIVCPSQWLADCVAKSRLFQNRKITVIPNGLDTRIFRPGDKYAIRRARHFPDDRKIILFGAIDIVTDSNKGYHLLTEALHIFGSDEINFKPQLVVFGNKRPLPDQINGIPLIDAGFITDSKDLAELYSAADVTVVPSLIESFGQTASESLACGTPVVCFDTSGLKSIVDHKENGYLAKCYDPSDLAKGIEWVCENDQRHFELSRNARTKAENEFSLKSLGENYSALYEQVLAKPAS